MRRIFSFLMVSLMAVGSLWAETQSETYSSSVPSQATDVMLQAFYWDSYTDQGYGRTQWDALLTQADELGSYFDLVWLPPCSKSTGGTGYIPLQYDNLTSDWGNESQLRSLINALHNKNAKVVADIVINHNGGSCGWCCFGAMSFGEYGTFYPDASWITTEDEVWSASSGCTVGANAHADDGYGDERNYGPARDWDHRNTQVQEMCRAYLKWMKNDVGFDGWRYDYGKGFHHSHIDDYNKASGAYFSVVEYWDGNPDVLSARLEDANWNNMVFDFGTKYDALNNGICSFNYAKCKGAGMLGRGLGKHSVTFVDNHDTFTRNDSEFGGQNNSMTSGIKDRLLQANAYILSMPGLPCVFYPHWVTYKNEIKKMIEARHKTGVHSESQVKDESAEEGGYQATIVGKKGYIVLQLGNKASGTISGFTKHASGNGYAIWIYTNGYYLKNNWNGEDWSWKKMDEDGDNFKLENVVFGGNGVNYNTSNSDAGAEWVGIGDILGDEIGALDTVTFVLDPKAGTITATLLGKYVEPEQPEEVDSMTVYMVNTLDWPQVNTFVWADKAYKEWPGETSKKEADQINGKDVYAYTFPASFANIIFNNGPVQTVDLLWEEDKPYFVPGEADGDGKIKGAWYAKANIPVDEPEQPEEPEEHVYSVAGSEGLFGSNWNEKEGNEMIKQEDGTYQLVIEDIELVAATYEFKVVIDHKWLNGEAEENSTLVIEESGKYDVTITYNPVVPETGANAVLKEATVVIPTVKLAGSFTEWDAAAKELTLDDSKLFATVKVNLEKGNHAFKIIVGGNWLGNVYEFTRDHVGLADLTTNTGDMHLSADAEGEYIFTWTFANDSLGITFPEKSADPDRLQEGYYLIGLNGWTVESIQPADLFIINPSNAAEYFLADVTLTEGALFKAVYVKNDAIDSWIPGGEGNDYVVDAAHAGIKTIYFRPEGNEDWGGHFYVAPNAATDFEHINASDKAVKVIRDGQLYLMYKDRMYNVHGQTVK